MTPIADMIERMLAGGVAPQFIVLAVRVIEATSVRGLSADMSALSADNVDSRKVKDRERKRLTRERAKQNQSVTTGAQANDGASGVDSGTENVRGQSADMSADNADKCCDLSYLLKEKELTEKVSKGRKKEVDGSARGTRLSADSPLCDADREFAREVLGHDQIDQIWIEFCDYWISVPGARGRKANWSATWRNRVRDISTRGSGNGRPAWKNGREPSAITRAVDQRIQMFGAAARDDSEIRETAPRLLSDGRR